MSARASKSRTTAKAKPSKGPKPPTYELRLYVAGRTERAMTALSNLRKVCDEHLAGRYSVEVIDLLEKPHLAKGEQILALPTLVRKLPTPIRKIVGDLSNTERVLVGLDLKAAS